jgi:hypothetical protein
MGRIAAYSITARNFSAAIVGSSKKEKTDIVFHHSEPYVDLWRITLMFSNFTWIFSPSYTTVVPVGCSTHAKRFIREEKSVEVGLVVLNGGSTS